uniref:Uncharacterized protein n=1 Tax=Ditylum brightwellii TaxID=49249 RepID=A0A7S4VND7_9STRA
MQQNHQHQSTAKTASVCPSSVAKTRIEFPPHPRGALFRISNVDPNCRKDTKIPLWIPRVSRVGFVRGRTIRIQNKIILFRHPANAVRVLSLDCRVTHHIERGMGISQERHRS